MIVGVVVRREQSGHQGPHAGSLVIVSLAVVLNLAVVLVVVVIVVVVVAATVIRFVNVVRVVAHAGFVLRTRRRADWPSWSASPCRT